MQNYYFDFKDFFYTMFAIHSKYCKIKFAEPTLLHLSNNKPIIKNLALS